MTLQDFIQKEVTIAREHGIGPAVKQAASEATIKAARPLAAAKSRAIWDADWDICLVLDSCRADTWQTVVDGGTFPTADDYRDTAWSVGSASPEWISETFADEHRESWRRAGYVTSNPFSAKDGTEGRYLDECVYPLHTRGLAYLDEVWRDQWGTEGLPTVGPGEVTERALWAWQRRDRYDIEQLVVHYMQPHVPFRARPEWTKGWDLERFGTGGGHGKNDWHKLRDGEVNAGVFWSTYRDNLRWVLDAIRPIVDGTGADILVTSDHGNAAGEWQQWGHPPGSANPAIRRVPWVSVTGAGERAVDATPAGSPPIAGPQLAGECVDQQLAALGYK